MISALEELMMLQKTDKNRPFSVGVEYSPWHAVHRQLLESEVTESGTDSLDSDTD
eukprot:CAMPEP_0184327342 /NCGR_PEP_ID=MMETSP1049-20130417/143046_1 /TAXON_ID=77928 /ORGANISM="Proteomonas sulcata, Strain CCMP704" /LENGTH=54 /DNA_ID=CAMNT_0026649597 /DNA_START=923 /DNA_END=1087 /DNA_ORIENTATION=-